MNINGTNENALRKRGEEWGEGVIEKYPTPLTTPVIILLFINVFIETSTLGLKLSLQKNL